MTGDSGETTIETYGRITDSYAVRAQVRPPAVIALLDRLAALARSGSVLELGSGPGVDADLLEERGLTVQRTDGTPGFVARMRARGHDARVLDVRRDPLGGPYDAVLANAVLLHLTGEELALALKRIAAAVQPGGAFALTLKEGDGEGFTSAKVGHPRWFTYWREGPLRALLTETGWAVESLEHVRGPHDHWLHVIARAAAG